MDAKRLYTARVDAYQVFNAVFRSPQALRAFFQRYESLRPGMRVLDAGCGTGAATIALLEAMCARGIEPASVHGFDLTPAMLDRFQRELARRRDLPAVSMCEADVLGLEQLPADWTDYDLVVSVAMLEYVPVTELVHALGALRERLAPQGRLLIFVTRRNAVTRPLIGSLWQARCYDRAELENAFVAAGLGSPRVLGFPATYFWQNVWAHVLEGGPVRSA